MEKDFHQNITLDSPNFGQHPVLIRTGNITDVDWETICTSLKKEDEEGFYVYIDFLNDKKLYTSTPKQIKKLLKENKKYDSSFAFIATTETMSIAEHPILCIGFDHVKNFYVISDLLASIENNLSIANLLFDEFYILQDKDGIIRNWNTK